MPSALKSLPRTWAGDVVVQGSDCSTTLRAQHVTSVLPTVATTGATEVVLMANGPGTISLVKVVFKDALTTDNTNFVTFALTNKGQANAGTTAVLASSAAGVNTTKVTGGAAIGAYTPKSLTLSAVAGALTVVAGDILVFTATATGTLANTLTEGFLKIVVDQLT